MSLIWKSPADVLELLETLKLEHHPELELAKFTVAFDESKPFNKDRFNWGNVYKFSQFNKLWQVEKFDFCILLCSEIWYSILSKDQQTAWIDLHLTRCGVEYIPETVMEGKKKKVVKDDWGRIKYTTEMKLDDDGRPKWVINPLDLPVFCKNASRYGLWCPALSDLQTVIGAT